MIPPPDTAAAARLRSAFIEADARRAFTSAGEESRVAFLALVDAVAEFLPTPDGPARRRRVRAALTDPRVIGDEENTAQDWRAITSRVWDRLEALRRREGGDRA